MEYRIANIALHFFVVLVAPPFFIGVINRVKSIFAGRKGPPIFQLYFDIFKLLRKGAVYSKSTTALFRIVPLIILVAIVCASGFVPITGVAPLDFSGDIILFVYMFALARFLMIVSAMDTASSFEGMGASREATFGAFSELTMFTVLITLAIITRSMSLNEIFHWTGSRFLAEPSVVILFLAFFFILLTENSRMPIDDPNTHLELTMVHEVMILDNSGPDLGIILYGASIKLFIFMLFAALLISPNVQYGPWVGSAMLMLKVFGVAVAVGVIESVTARIKFIRIPQMLLGAFVLSLFALLISLYGRGML